jgi:hypothetical protein
LQCRERILVALGLPIESQRCLELPLGLFGRIPATVTLKVSQIRLQRRDDATSLYGADWGSGELSKPFLGPRFCVVEFECFSD